MICQSKSVSNNVDCVSLDPGQLDLGAHIDDLLHFKTAKFLEGWLTTDISTPLAIYSVRRLAR